MLPTNLLIFFAVLLPMCQKKKETVQIRTPPIRAATSCSPTPTSAPIDKKPAVEKKKPVKKIDKPKNQSIIDEETLENVDENLKTVEKSKKSKKSIKSKKPQKSVISQKGTVTEENDEPKKSIKRHGKKSKSIIKIKESEKMAEKRKKSISKSKRAEKINKIEKIDDDFEKIDKSVEKEGISIKNETKEELVPREIPLTTKEERIAMGLKCPRGNYMTMEDVISDWDSPKPSQKKKNEKGVWHGKSWKFEKMKKNFFFDSLKF